MPETTLHDVAQNIMNEPISEEVKRAPGGGVQNQNCAG